MGPSYQKISHRKVRSGCAQCKKRRVKCDESKPSCRNCLRYPSKCSFSCSSSEVLSSRPDASPRALLPSYPMTRKTSLSSISLNRSPEDISSKTGFSFADFELLHHWTAYTADSMAPNPELQAAMREIVPQVAFKHDGLMHAMLAITSLHISHLQPDKSSIYVDRASYHYALALPYIRSDLANINESNSHAIYASGHLLLKYAFARPQELDSLVFTSPGGMVSEWVLLVRGAFSLHANALHWLRRGPWAAALETIVTPVPKLTQNPEDHQYAKLLPLFDGMNSEIDAHVCREALDALRRLLALAADPRQTISVKTLTYLWPAQVPQRYVEMLGEKNQFALVVLGHYCVMLKGLEKFWFMKNCASRLLKHIMIQLEEQWMPYIEWPLGIVGLQ